MLGEKRNQNVSLMKGTDKFPFMSELYWEGLSAGRWYFTQVQRATQFMEFTSVIELQRPKSSV